MITRHRQTLELAALMQDKRHVSDEIARLASLSGRRAGRTFLQLMIGHLRATIKLAEAELAGGGNAEAMALARTIAETQRQELDRMRTMLELYR